MSIAPASDCASNVRTRAELNPLAAPNFISADFLRRTKTFRSTRVFPFWNAKVSPPSRATRKSIRNDLFERIEMLELHAA
jgi:hypothetical protein